MTDDSQLTAALTWAADLSQLLLLVGGTVLLAKQIVRERGQPPENLVPWRVRWPDFGLWMCTIMIALSASSMLLTTVYPLDPGQKLSNFDSLVFGGVGQIAAIAVLLAFLWSRSVLSPAPVNRESWPLTRILGQGALAYLTAFPLICIASQGWQLVIDYAQNLYPQVNLPEQTVVKLIENHPDAGEVCLTLLFAVGLAPLAEELLFRAGIYRFLKGKFSTRAALGITSLCFAAAHANWLQSVPLFVVGWLLARSYERSGHIGVPMVFHALFNLSNIVMMLLSPGQ